MGTNYEMILVIAAKMNFTPFFKVYDYFPTHQNNTLMTLIQKLNEDEIEIAGNGFWKTLDRVKHVEFTYPFDVEDICIVLKKNNEDHRYLFLAPFTWDASESLI